MQAERVDPVHELVLARRPSIDLARLVALMVVVLGHLTLAVVDRDPAGKLRGENLFSLRPGWAIAGLLAPMPIFFVAAGWANSKSGFATTLRRLKPLVGAAASVVSIWSGAYLIAVLSTGSQSGLSKNLADGARLATQPLWFLGAYIPLAATATWLARLMNSRRTALPAFFIAIAMVCLGDYLVHGRGWPRWVAFGNFFIVWACLWCAGSLWRRLYESSVLDARREAGVGLGLVFGAVIVGWFLVNRLGYSVSLIDFDNGARSNTTPTGLYMLVAGLGQSGILILFASHADRLGARFKRQLDSLGLLAIGVYIWHLSAMALLVALIAMGFPAPERLSGWWWASRPVWYLAVIALTLGLIACARRLTPKAHKTARESTKSPLRENALATAGVVLSTASALLIGLRGPRSVFLAVVCCITMLGAWALIGASGLAENRASEAGKIDPTAR